ncbi:MAG: hypothetical protein LBV30_03850 [Propionibacteriaceae bacterium]|jgi:septation ring formation regulator EzrA|nr:hypothetical protein [Propionibacteriaceae bacterium]
MAENLAQARKAIEGQRAAIREHISKYHRYQHPDDKMTAWKTIQNAQEQIRKLKRRYPGLDSYSSEDSWSPR